MVGKDMIDYIWLVMSILFLISSVLNGVRWFVIRKDYKVSSFLVVTTQLIAFLVLLIMAFL